jgi:hypothetical protein
MHTVAGVLLKGISFNQYNTVFEHKKRPPALHYNQPKARKAL